MTKISDPLERTVAAALDTAKISYRHSTDGLDFYLPERDLYIEVKRMHSKRIAAQMAQADNVIAVQGVGSVTFMADLIRRAGFHRA